MYKIRFKKIKFFFIAFFVVIFQASLFNILSFAGHVKPDFILLTLIFFSLYNGAQAGMACGMCLGILMDSLSGGVLGVNCISLGLVGLLIGLLKDRVYTGHLLTKLLVPFFAGIIANILYYFIASNFYRVPGFTQSFPDMAGALLYTVICNVFYFDFLEKSVIIKITTLA